MNGILLAQHNHSENDSERKITCIKSNSSESIKIMEKKDDKSAIYDDFRNLMFDDGVDEIDEEEKKEISEDEMKDNHVTRTYSKKKAEQKVDNLDTIVTCRSGERIGNREWRNGRIDNEYRQNEFDLPKNPRIADCNGDNDNDELDGTMVWMRKKKLVAVNQVGGPFISWKNSSQRVSTRDSIKYNWKTICSSEDDTTCCCNSGSLCRDSVSMESNDDKERKSDINFELTDNSTIATGMNLHSTPEGHFIEVEDSNNNYHSRLSLRNKDNLLGINDQAVDQYHHNIVLEILRHFLQTEETISLIVERNGEHGIKEVVEIKLDFQKIPQDENMVKIEAEVCFSANYYLNIKCVKLKTIFNCRIHNGGRTNHYLTTDNSNDLRMRPLKLADKKKNIFKCYQFHGLCIQRGRRPEPIFIGVFQSFDTNYFVMASSKTKLTLVSIPSKLNTNVKQITRADPRFFVVGKTSNGQSYFESLLYRGHYWTLHDNALRLTSHKSSEMFLRNESHFHFVPGD